MSWTVVSLFFNRSSGNLPGEVPIQVVSSTEKDRPAGTSWIFPGGSQVLASTVTGGDADDGGEVFHFILKLIFGFILGVRCCFIA